MNYSEILRELRTNNKLTQTEIGNILEINWSTYKDYELNLKTIPTKHLNSLCNYYDISFDYILGFTNKKQYKNSERNIDKVMVGNRLKDFRKEHKLTAKTLADILKTTDGTLYGYEHGRYIIAIPFLYDICKRYNISADYLLGKIDSPKYLK